MCNSSVNFIIDRDPEAEFQFAALQSDLAAQLLPPLDIDPGKLESFVLYTHGRAFRRSRAALEIARRMNGAWPLMYGFIIIPGFIRNVVYDFIARNRYKWFGKKDECRIPTPELKARFVG